MTATYRLSYQNAHDEGHAPVEFQLEGFRQAVIQILLGGELDEGEEFVLVDHSVKPGPVVGRDTGDETTEIAEAA